MDRITRRDFASGLVAGGAALLLPGCGVRGPAVRGALERTAASIAASNPLRSLAHEIRGPVMLPGSARYRRARLIYNERYDGRTPRALVQPVNTRDVQALVRWAGRNRVRLAIRSGGHSYAGYSTIENGVMVDLRRLRGVRLNRGNGIATIGPGAQLIDIYSALAAHGATIPGGSCPSVGIGGHSLGGGMGLAGRNLGLACDRIRAARIVTADGRVLRCDPSHHPDLFWALRGAGGGSFGIVTQLELATARASHASWFLCSWPWSMASEVLNAWQKLAPHAPAALTSIFTLATGASHPTVTAIGQYFGAEAKLRRLIAPLTKIDGASLSIGTSGYLELQRRWAGCLHGSPAACHTRGTRPGGTLARARFAAKSDYVDQPLSARARAQLVSAVERRQGASGALVFDAYGGAINKVATGATAFVHRDQLFCVQELAYFGPSGQRPALRWLRSVHSALRPHASGEAYQNYTDPDLAGWRQAYYASNYARLTQVKGTYDPDNRFRFGQSIGLQ
jgi:FAD/FMN-containing dehydrogenase